MSKPRLLDLFCGAGGAAMGYHRAGFDVVGVDIAPQPRYPFDFIQMDAMEFLRFPEGAADVSLRDEFDAIHASPPCQRYAVSTRVWAGRSEEHPDLVEPTRDLLDQIGLPYVIENVPGAPLRDPIMLCGAMFDGLRVYRHRNFECSPPIYWPPDHPKHVEIVAAVGKKVGPNGWMTVAGHFQNIPAARIAMGIDWMKAKELAEAIPPAYTEWIGARLMETVRRNEALRHGVLR